MSVRGPNNVERAVQTDPTWLRYASVITEQKRCFELFSEKFDQFQTSRNNSQQHSTGCANGRDLFHPTMLRPFAQGFMIRSKIRLA